MTTSIFFSPLALALTYLAARRIVAARRSALTSACNTVNAEVGTHEGNVTRVADAAVTTKFLVGKKGASGNDYVDICGASDIPLYIMTDEAADEEQIACDILGSLGRTAKVVASEAIAVGEDVYTAASGKVQNLPIAAGTYYCVGRAMTAAAADGDLVEISSQVATKLVVV